MSDLSMLDVDLMQRWEMTVDRFIVHAERWHGSREVVGRLANGAMGRTTWAALAGRARNRITDRLLSLIAYRWTRSHRRLRVIFFMAGPGRRWAALLLQADVRAFPRASARGRVRQRSDDESPWRPPNGQGPPGRSPAAIVRHER